MNKKAILLISGAVVATSAFLLYTYFTNSELTTKPTPPKLPTANEYRKGLQYADDSTGTKVNSDTFEPIDKGYYRVTNFRAEWAMGNNQKFVLEADKGEVESIVDAKGNPQGFKKFDLEGNIIITFGATDSFETTTPTTNPATKPGTQTAEKRRQVRKPGQLQVVFKDSSKLTYVGRERELKSGDAVTILSDQVSFSGKGLRLSINQVDERIEYLRIAEGDKINIKPDEQGDIKFGFASTKPAADPLQIPKTKPAATAATKPKKSPTQYILDFSENVKITHGDVNFQGERLQLTLFDDVKDLRTKTTTAPAKAAATRAATKTADASPLSGKNLEWDDKQETNITWKGPLEVRPKRDDDSAFALAHPKDIRVFVFGTDKTPLDAKWGASRLVAHNARFDVLHSADGKKDNDDVILDAKGNANYPVTIEDGKSFARGGEIRFERLSRKGYIKKGDYKEAEVQFFDKDNLVFSANNPSIVVSENISRIDLEGSGRASFATDMFEATGEAKAGSKKILTDITFSKGLHVVTDTLPNAKDPAKPHIIWKNVLLDGPSTVKHPSLDLKAGNALELKVAASIVEKGGAVTVRHELDHILASGGVTTKFARPGLTLAEKDAPDMIESDSLEVLTKKIADTRQIDEIRFRREGAPVVALLHQMSSDKNEKKENGEKGKEPRLLTQRVEAPAITAFLNPRTKSATAPATASSDFGVNIREISATGGIKAVIEGFSGMVAGGDEKLVVTAGEFKAFPGPSNTSRIELIGQKTLAGITPVKLVVGKNFVEGNTVRLDQSAQSIFIPGDGQFQFVDEADKTKPVPYAMTWKDRDLGGGKIAQSSMSFDQKKKEAVIKGLVEGSSTGEPGKESSLTAYSLTIGLLQEEDKKSTTQPKDRFGLKSMTVEGNVVAKGKTFDPATKSLLTAQEIHSEKLTYSNDTREAKSPVPGYIKFFDLRPPEKTAAAQPAVPLAGANMRGGARIDWKGTLTYNGDTGMIDLDKDVALQFLPTENTKAGGTAVNEGNLTTLTAQHLGIKMDTSKAEKGAIPANPAALGSFKVLSFIADGGANLMRGPASMRADKLSLDPTKNIARGDGNVEVSPDQKTSSKLQSFTWDLSKEGNAFEVGNTVIRTNSGGQ